MPIEGGAFYHVDTMDASRPVYKQHFTKLLLAYAIWLHDNQFASVEKYESANLRTISVQSK